MGVLECEKRSAKTGFLIVVGTLKKGRIQTIKPARCGLYFNSGSGGWIRTNDGYETDEFNPPFLCQKCFMPPKLVYKLGISLSEPLETKSINDKKSEPELAQRRDYG